MRQRFCETSICKSIDETSTARIAARIFYQRFVCFRFIIFSHRFKAVFFHISDFYTVASLHAAVNESSFACGPNCNDAAVCVQASGHMR